VSSGSFAQKPQKAVEISQSEKFNRRRQSTGSEIASSPAERRPLLYVFPQPTLEPLSPWARSAAKRCFDCTCVLLALPVLVPILLLVALGVRLTSRGPVLFLQKRVGASGRIFTILKFRTMLHDADALYHAVTTADNQPFTSIGPFLRRWKLDELPQVFNVLAGHMSLVGPRPKMPEHVSEDLPCRPGITGAATVAFAREETMLDRVPRHHLNTYYHTVVLPTKRQMDAEYMARATFSSDLKLVIDSILRRWDGSLAADLLNAERVAAEVLHREARVQRTETVEDRIPVSEPVRTGTR
jgi:lipopolysaccharide/colanic/teichoic acid biosynthesis glycosyltransferase